MAFVKQWKEDGHLSAAMKNEGASHVHKRCSIGRPESIKVSKGIVPNSIYYVRLTADAMRHWSRLAKQN